jgi:hypothetical protein
MSRSRDLRRIVLRDSLKTEPGLFLRFRFGVQKKLTNSWALPTAPQ